MSWKITALKLQLNEIHPQVMDFKLTSETLYMVFDDGTKRNIDNFVWGTETSKALYELEQLLRSR